MAYKTLTLNFAILFICIAVQAQTNESVSKTSTFAPIPLNEISIKDDEIHSWSSQRYPQPYPSESEELIIKTNTGFFISVTVESLDLDGASGDFLLVKPGLSKNDENKGKVFTYHLNNPRKYLIQSNNAFMGFYVLGTNEAGKKGFMVKYQRVGEEVTTTEAPTTDVTWPTPSILDSTNLTVYALGKSPVDFSSTQTLNNFKKALAEMATEYCDTNNFELTDSITTKNIQIYYAVQCPFTWPDSDMCVKVHFALPVFVKENTAWSGYQLTTAHLEPMWDQLAEKYLAKYNMSVYQVPNNDSALIKWTVIICVVIILFLVLLCFVKMLSQHFSPMNQLKRRSSDTSIIIKSDDRTNRRSLGPHPLQVTPPFFDNDYSFQQFEPDVGIPSKSSYDYPLSEDDSDNEIIFTNFSNSRNNIPEKDPNNESMS